MLNSASNWLFPVPSPHVWPVLCHRFAHQPHLNGFFCALKVKAILPPGLRCLYLKQDGFFSTSGTHPHWEHRGYLKVIPDFPNPYLPHLFNILMAGPLIAFLRAQSQSWVSRTVLKKVIQPFFTKASISSGCITPHALIFRLSWQCPELNTLWATSDFSLHLSRALLLFIKSGQGVSDYCTFPRRQVFIKYCFSVMIVLSFMLSLYAILLADLTEINGILARTRNHPSCPSNNSKSCRFTKPQHNDTSASNTSSLVCSLIKVVKGTWC